MTKKRRYSNNKTAKHGNNQNLEVNADAVKVLRTVGDQEAFYFYEAIGKPTGETAKNLNDFLNKVKTVKAESLKFHLQRKDFQNWVAKILGDAKLARELGRIPESNTDDARMIIAETVENRIKELKTSSTAAAITVADNSVLVSAS
jgi:hypothetical protein